MTARAPNFCFVFFFSSTQGEPISCCETGRLELSLSSLTESEEDSSSGRVLVTESFDGLSCCWVFSTPARLTQDITMPAGCVLTNSSISSVSVRSEKLVGSFGLESAANIWS
eukprot:Lithocolla_globosa_v1_NODE_966_length_3014_cov_12.896249.p2 type:complete len:112 gc:universal NODE_966_length_3014_cov_12.896249:338-673(+)